MSQSCSFSRVIYAGLACSTLLFSWALEASPSVLYLTWVHDPTTTMTIQWHTVIGKHEKDVERGLQEITRVSYRRLGSTCCEDRSGVLSAIPGTRVWVHTVELDGLEPDTLYEFCLANDGEWFTFQTLPQHLERPVRFVVGGDAYYHLDTLRKMNRQIAASDPDFVVVGGDIAYTYGTRIFLNKTQQGKVKRWRQFLKEWKTQLRTSTGKMIPLLPVLGNHDIRGIGLDPLKQRPLFYALFAMPEEGCSYRTLDVGNYLSLFLLDSGHYMHVAGQQTQWLKQALAKRENIAYKFAAYHIASYPSVYPYQGATPKEMRREWNPLFERYHLNVAFEHHNHAYKRTFALKQGEINPDGVVYMGDGSWGISARKPKPLWYLEKRAQANAVCLVTLTRDKGTVEALDIRGDVIDAMDTPPHLSYVGWSHLELLP